jgi:hypothetical protein
MEAEEAAAAAKRARSDDGEAVTPEVVSNGISAVIPGWFSEISPMWPGVYFSPYLRTSLIKFIESFLHLCRIDTCFSCVFFCFVLFNLGKETTVYSVLWINIGHLRLI